MKQVKELKLKGVFASIAGIISVSVYILYFFSYYYGGYRLDEAYFANNCFTTAIFTYLCHGFFSQKFVRVVLLFTSVFYSMLLLTYVGNWLLLGTPYAWIKFSLIAGLLIGLIYYIYDSATNST